MSRNHRSASSNRLFANAAFASPSSSCRQEIFGWQVAFEAIPLRPVRIRDDDRGCPLRAEPLEAFWVFLDVNLDWQEMLLDERRHAFVGVRLGIQPSACSSHRRGAEIEQ